MGLIKRKKGVREQLADALVAALTQAGPSQPQQPAPKKRRLSGTRGLVAGAALYTAGREVARRRGSSDEPEDIEGEAEDDEDIEDAELVDDEDDEPVEDDEDAPIEDDEELEDQAPRLRTRVRWMQ